MEVPLYTSTIIHCTCTAVVATWDTHISPTILFSYLLLFLLLLLNSRGGTGVNVAKTLDLLKAVTQSSFNQEIKKLCDDYLQVWLAILYTVVYFTRQLFQLKKNLRDFNLTKSALQ